MMTLFWSSRSPYVRKVMVVAHEFGLVDRLELVRVDVATVRASPQISALNPLGKIPVLILEDGATLYDSGVICEYFSTLNEVPFLFPRDPSARILALRRQALGNGMMDVLVVGRAEAKRPDGSRSLVHVEAYDRKLGDILASLEGEAERLTRDAFSIGHIAIGCALDYMNFRYAGREWRTTHPTLGRWHDGFLERRSVRETAHAEVY
jgi:glutathione S-transferase